MKAIMIIVLMLCSTLIYAQRLNEATVTTTSGSITMTDTQLEKCDLTVHGVSYTRALDILVDVTVKSRCNSEIGGFDVVYDNGIYTLTNHATGQLIMTSKRISDVRSALKKGELKYAILGVL